METGFKKRLGIFWRNSGKPILIVIIVLSAMRSSFADWNDVPTGSMKPTILEGDRIFVNKLAYDLKVPFTNWRLVEWSEPQRGEIVILFSPKDGTRLVKRIVGVPGDRIELRNNRLAVNGSVLEYDYGGAGDALDDDVPSHVILEEHLGDHEHTIAVTAGLTAPRLFGPVTVPADSFIVMGDNRDNSADSRVFGFVPRDRIVGRSSRVLISLNPKNYYLPRWSRFFKVLP